MSLTSIDLSIGIKIAVWEAVQIRIQHADGREEAQRYAIACSATRIFRMIDKAAFVREHVGDDQIKNSVYGS